VAGPCRPPAVASPAPDDDQELDSRRSSGAVYWEGAVRVAEDGREIGRGYLEMTGYGEKIRVA
jgi:predicted secreted hydrolase